LLDISSKIDAATVSTLSTVDKVTSTLNVPYLVIGATARDMVLHYGYNTPIQRATFDIDFAIQIETWEYFNRVRDQLIANDFTSTKNKHRLVSPTNIPIDIIPFGGVEDREGNIAWPPAGETVMSVSGFQEAITNAQQVLVNKEPAVVCPVVTPEGLMVLKLISWSERSRERRKNDATDIQYILSNYLEIKNILDDVYNDNNADIIARYDWDPNQASCSLLGIACKELVSDGTYAEIVKLHDSNNVKNIERIVEEMSGGVLDKNLKLLEAFMNGFTK